jgi:hypothetical protein
MGQQTLLTICPALAFLRANISEGVVLTEGFLAASIICCCPLPAFLPASMLPLHH